MTHPPAGLLGLSSSSGENRHGAERIKGGIGLPRGDTPPKPPPQGPAQRAEQRSTPPHKGGGIGLPRGDTPPKPPPRGRRNEQSNDPLPPQRGEGGASRRELPPPPAGRPGCVPVRTRTTFDRSRLPPPLYRLSVKVCRQWNAAALASADLGQGRKRREPYIGETA